ncbi:MAG: FkbM family methyltransferase [Deltaproteobacteria bacterium]|nr:FkbM family methyltransferase [Deltaproteobacteria bacterium]
MTSMTTPLKADSHKVLPITLSFNGREIEFTLTLDTSLFGQKIMWDYLSRGRLNEPETSQFVIHALKPGDCFLDIGAHIGYFSLLASALVGDDGKVISFEPDEANFNHLNQNIMLNSFLNIHARNQALGATIEKKTFFINSDADGGHALWDVGLHPFNKKSRVNRFTRDIQVQTIDSIIGDHQIDNLKLIKIDTEGAEQSILQGGVKTIQKHQVPYIICEINRFGLGQMNSNEFSFRSFVEAMGYQPYLLADGRNGPLIIRLKDHQTLDTQNVFNLLFVRNGIALPEAYIKE